MFRVQCEHRGKVPESGGVGGGWGAGWKEPCTPDV